MVHHAAKQIHRKREDVTEGEGKSETSVRLDLLSYLLSYLKVVERKLCTWRNLLNILMDFFALEAELYFIPST